MRLWTIHPRHLDRQGLLALWRESLLAQAVLMGRTRGYKRHPQLMRFRSHPRPVAAIATYLAEVRREACRRGYCFDAARISRRRTKRRIAVTRGQLLYEWQHLGKKLKRRDAAMTRSVAATASPTAHPIFRIVEGDVEQWEKRGRRLP